jgi:hypothetical protein
MILFKAVWWLVSFPFRLVFWLALLAEDGGDQDAEVGRKRWLAGNHPTSHLPRHNR